MPIIYADIILWTPSFDWSDLSPLDYSHRELWLFLWRLHWVVKASSAVFTSREHLFEIAHWETVQTSQRLLTLAVLVSTVGAEEKGCWQSASWRDLLSPPYTPLLLNHSHPPSKCSTNRRLHRMLDELLLLQGWLIQEQVVNQWVV